MPVALALLRDRRLTLDTRVVEHLPAFDSHPHKDEITVAHLLTHASGLPATRPYGTQRLPAATIRAQLLTEPLHRPPGLQVTYSDVGFLVLGRLLEQVSGTTLDGLLARYVTGPLGLQRTRYGPVEAGEAAATEPRPDGTPCRGSVHDEIAAQLAAPAAHAGVFSTVGDLAAYLAAWTADTDAWLPQALRRLATRDHTNHVDGHRGLGWTARHDPYDQLGEAWPHSAAFHSGFTGTSLALDLGSGHPLRRAIHTALLVDPRT